MGKELTIKDSLGNERSYQLLGDTTPGQLTYHLMNNFKGEPGRFNVQQGTIEWLNRSTGNWCPSTTDVISWKIT